MTTLWFFKRIKNHPEYLICSDRTVYTKRGCRPMNEQLGRQRYKRAQLFTNGKRFMRSVEYLFKTTFFPTKPPQPKFVPLEDCPF